MIEFKLTQTQQQTKEMTHWFAANEMRPISMIADKLGKVPDDWLAKVNKMGITMAVGGGSSSGAKASSSKPDDPDVDPEVKRQTNRTTVVAAEEVGWGDPAIALTLPGPGLGGPPVQGSGTPEQKQRFLSIFTKDEPRWGAYALTEPEAGSDVSNIRTTARKVDGGYVLNGQKIFITNGGRASWVVVFATVDRSAGRAGHRAFVVEQGTPGFRCSRLAHKMGMRASETAELVLEDCFVPDDNLLGGEAYYERRAEGKGGFQVAMATFDNTRPVVAAMAVGIAQGAFDYTLDFVKREYPKSGRLYQLACEKLAQMAQTIHAGRLLTWQAAWMADIGQANSKEAAICKAYAGKNALKVCETCLELLGPAGLDGHIVEKLYRDVKVYDIFEGTNQVQHLIVARRLYDAFELRI